jgi:hypothetical protein
MAQPPSPIHFEDIPIDEARWIGRGPRMDPELYHALHQKLQSLDNSATRMTIPEGTSSTTLKNRILRVAAVLDIPVTIRKVPGGLLFWRSTDEDVSSTLALLRGVRLADKPLPPSCRAGHLGGRRQGIEDRFL